MFCCKNCGETIERKDGKRAETLIIICPKCHSVVEASSCYGFGPVWPACIYCGDRLLAEIERSGSPKDPILKLKILGSPMPLPISEQLRKDNYKKHFDICEIVIQMLLESMLI